MAFIKD